MYLSRKVNNFWNWKNCGLGSIFLSTNLLLLKMLKYKKKKFKSLLKHSILKIIKLINNVF